MNKEIIIWFSSTGNSYALAQQLAKYRDCEIVSLIDLVKHEQYDFTAYDKIGVIYPVYALGLPKILERWIKKMQFNADCYIYTIANYGGKPGQVNRIIQNLFWKVHRFDNIGSWSIKMPENYIPLREALSEGEQNELFEQANGRMSAIALDVAESKVGCWDDSNAFLGFIGKISYFFFKYFSSKSDVFLRVSDQCTLCGLCEKICPVNNITIKDKVTFNHHCEHCLGCLQWCPAQAIDLVVRSKGRRRYRHPDMTVETMIASRRGPEDDE